MPRPRRLPDPRSALLAVVLTGAGLATPLLTGQAEAHSAQDPEVSAVLDRLDPALPPQVQVAVVPNVLDELTVSNPTATPLDVIAAGGEPFLRISAAGVLANLASPDWYSTGTPEGGPAVPAQVQRSRGAGPPRWVRVSRGSTWSEFDPRLYPTSAVPPAVRRLGRDATLTTWSVPLRYGRTATRATGRVLFRPVRGHFAVAVDPTSLRATGVPAAVLEGVLPGLSLTRPAGVAAVVVSGSDGQPFLRLTPSGVEANAASPSWAADQKARGRPVPAVGGPVRWVRQSPGSTVSWLDPRLRYPADRPPPAVLAATAARVVQHWQVPLTVDGAARALTGTVTWVPRATPTSARTGTGPSRAGVGGVVLGALVLLGAVLAVVRRRSRHA